MGESKSASSASIFNDHSGKTGESARSYNNRLAAIPEWASSTFASSHSPRPIITAWKIDAAVAESAANAFACAAKSRNDWWALSKSSANPADRNQNAPEKIQAPIASEFQNGRIIGPAAA
jgi:hypothetical protein